MTNRISEEDFHTLERRYPRGLTSGDLLDVCAHHGLQLSEATLRKYVQLGLLPRSVRVGRKGKHKGSLGLYPVRTIRRLARIKQMMSQSYTIEQIRRDFLFMRADIEQLEDVLSSVFRSLFGVLAERGRSGVTSVAVRDVKDAQRQGEQLIAQLSSLECRLTSAGHAPSGAAQAGVS